MGNTDVETGPDNAISQTPTRNGGANVLRAVLSKFKVNDRLFSFVKDYYLPVLFGLFGVFSLQAAGVANDQSLVANQLALLSLCSGNSVYSLIYFMKESTANIKT
jgi:hypothetical protein